jgi:translation initiation factor IF-3
LSRPFPRFSSSGGSFVRVNGKIRAREVRVIGQDGKQLGVLSLGEAITMARGEGVDLVEIAPNATPPVCRLVDYGKFRYEQSKKEKEARKHHHATKVKEIQLTSSIDPHDFGVKLGHAIEFLCDEMKVKVTLRFRGREMAHQEFGFQVVEKFVKALAAYGQPDALPKQIGKSVNVMLSPLPRNKRAKNPRQQEGAEQAVAVNAASDLEKPLDNKPRKKHSPPPGDGPPDESRPSGFTNNPFSQLDIKLTP